MATAKAKRAIHQVPAAEMANVSATRARQRKRARQKLIADN